MNNEIWLSIEEVSALTEEIKETVRKRITISDIDKGRELKREIYFLKLLIKAYDMGIIKENSEFKYIKVLK